MSEYSQPLEPLWPHDPNATISSATKAPETVTEAVHGRIDIIEQNLRDGAAIEVVTAIANENPDNPDRRRVLTDEFRYLWGELSSAKDGTLDTPSGRSTSEKGLMAISQLFLNYTQHAPEIFKGYELVAADPDWSRRLASANVNHFGQTTEPLIVLALELHAQGHDRTTFDTVGKLRAIHEQREIDRGNRERTAIERRELAASLTRIRDEAFGHADELELDDAQPSTDPEAQHSLTHTAQEYGNAVSAESRVIEYVESKGTTFAGTLPRFTDYDSSRSNYIKNEYGQHAETEEGRLRRRAIEDMGEALAEAGPNLIAEAAVSEMHPATAANVMRQIANYRTMLDLAALVDIYKRPLIEIHPTAAKALGIEGLPSPNATPERLVEDLLGGAPLRVSRLPSHPSQYLVVTQAAGDELPTRPWTPEPTPGTKDNILAGLWGGGPETYARESQNRERIEAVRSLFREFVWLGIPSNGGEDTYGPEYFITRISEVLRGQLIGSQPLGQEHLSNYGYSAPEKVQSAFRRTALWIASTANFDERLREVTEQSRQPKSHEG